ncbi:ribbon-helix-helix domain-containing protein [Pelagerythrobacter marensis]|uniref:Transcriptional regulator n=1 Tax=Pelagerythrobacter marensis TaxID=543877 RepID=A0A0G3XAC7_9SPHN|nr:ribbon-helix-helix domain-containing protein [Pelagerythrobacter marensis]AKM07561.1 transcriptional regulator [Pelagerythrobacter marensis]
MGKLERITVTMPEEMAAKLRAAVDSGSYATTSEVVREALRDWSDEQDRREAAIERLKEMVAEAEAGPSYPAEQAFAEIRQYVAEQAAKYRAEDR